MIGVLSPGFLWAGAALALVPLVLHLLARRPPERRALPTARFLREDARTRVTLQRRPRDLVLLAARMAFALTVGALFAGLTWSPSREGTGHVVLVDAGATTPAAWAGLAQAASEAAARRAAADERPLVLAYGLPEGPRTVPPGELPALRPGEVPARLEDGLRAMRRHLVHETRLASARVTWVASPRWSAWSGGFGLLRPALWPGRIDLVAVDPGADAAAPVAAADLPPVAAPGAAAEGSLARALRALGREVDLGPGAGAARGAPWVFARASDAGELARLVERARDGAAVVVWGDPPDAEGVLPWRPAPATGGSSPPPGAVVLPDGLVLDLPPTVRTGGTAAAGARVPAVFESGAPAAAARPLGDGCLAYAAVTLDAPALEAVPDYPRLLEALATACGAGGSDGPLDAGALAVVEGGADAPTVVDVAALALPDGRPLRPPLVILALALLAADVALSRGRPV